LIRSKLSVVLIALICLIGVRVDAALSLDARAVIEGMRSRINQVKTAPEQIANADSTDYVPGKALMSVLAKYRTQIYGNPEPTKKTLANLRVSAATSEQLDVTTYNPGQMLAKALENYRARRNSWCDVAPLDEPIVDETIQNGRTPANSSELFSESESALKISAGSKLKLPLSGSLKQSDATADPVDKPLDSASIADDKIVVEIQKFEFKMPRNYRIIVK